MRIVFVLAKPPSLLTGGQVRVYEIVRRLARHHQVHLILVTSSQSDADELGSMESVGCTSEVIMFPDEKSSRVGKWVRFFRNPRCSDWSPLARDRVCDQLAKFAPDVTIFEYTGMGQYLGTSPSPEVLSLADDYSLIHQRLFLTTSWSSYHKLPLGLAWLRFRQTEIALWQRARTIIAVSENERHRIQEYSPRSRVFVVPNGADVVRHSYQKSVTKDPNVLFLGTLSYEPNRDAVEYFCRSVWPLVKRRAPKARMLIVGYGSETLKGNPLFSSGGIEVVGTVESVTPWFAQARLLVVPLRIGAGTREKIIEAMAAGVPVLSTAIGAEGLHVDPGRHLIIEDSPSGMANAIERLIEDDTLVETLRSEARSLVESRYNWDTVVQGYERVLTEITQRTRSI